MKPRIVILLFILFPLVSLVYGQGEKPIKIKKLRLSEISIYACGYNEFTPDNGPGAVMDFKKLSPQAMMVNNDFSGFTYLSDYTGQLSGHGMYTVAAGFHLGNAQTSTYSTHFLFRIRLGYYPKSTPLSTAFQREEEEKPYDTIPTGPTYRYISSREMYTLEYTAEQLHLDADLIYKLNPEKRWSFQLGMGIGTWVSFNARTEFEYEKAYNITAYNSNGKLVYTFYSHYLTTSGLFPDAETIRKSEEYKSKNNYGFSAHVPLIINFRIGKKREFWKRVNLFYELNVSANAMVIPTLRTIAYIGLQNGIGLKVSIE